jgi:8-oxo-dGTP pyrophosphatase MutT (NUDIX family)
MENKETSQECALRELLEETGMKINPDSSIGYKKLPSGGYFVFNVEDETTLVPEDNSEITEGGWFSLEEIKKMRCNVDVNAFQALMQTSSIPCRS